ncbi:MAG: hypothetical protein WEB58_16010, partial [Planctomycetaceae bacterium]
MANRVVRQVFQRLTPDQKNVVFAIVPIIIVIVVVLVVFVLNAIKANRVGALTGEADRYRYEMALVEEQ